MGWSNPTLAKAQDRSVRIGLLTWSDCKVDSYLQERGEFGPFVRGLRELRYNVPKSLTFECRGGNHSFDGLSKAAIELAQLPVDVIVTMSQPAGRAAHDATHTIPIVSIVSGDPVAAGFAHSIAKPGLNVTGVSYYATELTAKRLELLKELMPSLATVDVLTNPAVSYLPFEADTKQAGNLLGIVPRIRYVQVPADLKVAFSQMSRENARAVFVLPDLMLLDQSSVIAALAIEHHLPTMTWAPWFTQDGCLMAYSADYAQMDHRLAFYVDRILNGTKPGDLPIEQPRRFALSINLKTAKALGVSIPEPLLLRADEVIE
jgi:putative ABC transport system substrate-binding protein